MTKLTTVLVLLISLLSLNNSVSSLQCYQCTGPLGINSDCENLVYIPPGACADAEVCARYILTNPEKHILHRTCAQRDVCSQLTTEFENVGQVSLTECNICEQDACNSS